MKERIIDWGSKILRKDWRFWLLSEPASTSNHSSISLFVMLIGSEASSQIRSSHRWKTGNYSLFNLYRSQLVVEYKMQSFLERFFIYFVRTLDCTQSCSAFESSASNQQSNTDPQAFPYKTFIIRTIEVKNLSRKDLHQIRPTHNQHEIKSGHWSDFWIHYFLQMMNLFIFSIIFIILWILLTNNIRSIQERD